MKIKMYTTKCGPVVSENWNEGQILDMSAEEVRAHVESGRGINLDPFPVMAEKAISTAPEKAVLNTPEFAGQGKAQAAAKSPAVAPPASPVAPVVAGNLTQPPAWGKGASK